jgi:hypothetical protein
MGFLSFLKEKKIINDEQIIEGMIYHYQSRVPLLAVLKSDGVLGNEKISALLDQSVSEQEPLYQVLLNNAAISKDKIDELMARQEEQSGSFANWLIEQGIVEMEQLKSLIQEYGSGDSPSPVEGSRTKKEKKEEDGGGINLAALESLSELGITSDEELEELKGGASEQTAEIESEPEVEKETPAMEKKSEETELSINSNGQLKVFFTDEKLQQLNNIIKKLALGMNIDSLKEMHTEIYKLLGVSKICQEKLMIKLLETWEKVITAIIEERVDFSKNNFTIVLKELKEGISLSWELKEQLIVQGNVKKFIKEGTSKERYLKNIQKALGFTK